MKKSIVILGAGGHGRVVLDIALLNGYENAIFLDDSDRSDVEVVGKTNEFKKYIKEYDFFVAIGNNVVRERITSMLVENNAELATLVHPSAQIGSNVRLGKGTVVVAGAVINTGAVIGEGVIVNTSSSVDHDDVISDYCHISVGSHLAGNVSVGKRCFIGAGATVINNVSICDDCMIGAGAVVVKNVCEKGTYVGVPARKIMK